MIKLSPVPDKWRFGCYRRGWVSSRLDFSQISVLICPFERPRFPDLLDLEDFPRVIRAQLTQVGLPLMGIPGLSIFTGYNESPMAKSPGRSTGGARFRDILISAAKRLRHAAPRWNCILIGPEGLDEEKHASLNKFSKIGWAGSSESWGTSVSL